MWVATSPVSYTHLFVLALKQPTLYHHGWSAYDEILRVPMILAMPGRLPAGVTVSNQVRLYDAAPTILESLGLWEKRAQLPSGNLQQGQSLVPVSYTHLDVYKRQGHDRAVKQSNGPANLTRQSLIGHQMDLLGIGESARQQRVQPGRLFDGGSYPEGPEPQLQLGTLSNEDPHPIQCPKRVPATGQLFQTTSTILRKHNLASDCITSFKDWILCRFHHGKP